MDGANGYWWRMIWRQLVMIDDGHLWEMMVTEYYWLVIAVIEINSGLKTMG